MKLVPDKDRLQNLQQYIFFLHLFNDIYAPLFYISIRFCQCQDGCHISHNKGIYCYIPSRVLSQNCGWCTQETELALLFWTFFWFCVLIWNINEWNETKCLNIVDDKQNEQCYLFNSLLILAFFRSTTGEVTCHRCYGFLSCFQVGKRLKGSEKGQRQT